MAGQDDAAPQVPDPAGRRSRGLVVATATVLALSALAGLAGWLASTESGLRALLGAMQRASGGALEVVAPSGRLIGPFGAQAVRYSSADLRVELEGVELDWSPAALLSQRLDVDHLAARRLLVARRAATQDQALAAPKDLRLPLAIDLRRVALDAFELRDLEAPAEPDSPPVFSFSGLSAALSSDGRQHRLSALALTLPQGRAELAAELDGMSPFMLTAQGRFAGMQGERSYALRVTADGTLIAPRIELDAEGEGLQGRAEVRAAPFDAMPLRALKLALGEIDPSALVAGAPRAALRLEAD
ncbi:MAG: DUF490 domain-containing protein, partial [Thauera sp.]|nr:DUF490 domain-containing protein [Thauera sp.]